MKQLNRPLKALSLFTGIGGLDLAAMRWGIQPIAFCEIDPFPCAVLRKRFPFIPILDDIRKVDGTQFGTVDIVYGGFPCQDLSQAGRKAGLVDGEGNVTRSGLWFEMLRIIREVRPSYVVVENVRGAVLHLRLVRHTKEKDCSSSLWPTCAENAWKGPRSLKKLMEIGRNPKTNTLAEAVRYYQSTTSGGLQTQI